MKQEIAITVDTVIFCIEHSDKKVLLIQRKNDPYKYQWALPGGFLEEDEELETGAKRELKEETGLKLESLKQLHAFGRIGRDPRGRTISIAFVGSVEKEFEVVGSDDAREAKWFSIKKLPELAFDHLQIISEATESLGVSV
ncbi:NUDIX hydrolase [Gillisia sp. M10.2A]|uniref:NUDIX hydrolase n=1 Tax=Gillisia lutea TaxID=2909668 RepID=A0ABS9EIR7_9FLAO|nr:NUDIX hydrolase [Gillisia lutea]MCF4101685.1 NUDIX hydrolase [Gillisia lutea]